MAIGLILAMLILMFAGMPVGFAMGLAGAVGLYLVGDWEALSSILTTVPFRTAASYGLTTVPMFILMAEVVTRAKIVEQVFLAANRWLERLSGGLGIATVIASAGMAAMCGSSVASAATMANVAVPNLIKYGYRRSIASGMVAVAGTLAIMIPPSVTFILYGIITETSIGKLLIAGIIPGILTAGMYVTGITIMAKTMPGMIPPPTRNFTSKERWDSLRPLWAFVIVVTAVIGSIYSGLATATEAAAFGALISTVISMIMKRVNLRSFNESCVTTIKTTTMIFTIIIGAMIFGYFLTITRTPQLLIEFVAAMAVPPWVIMGLVVILYLFLGCVMDSIAILFITLPIVFPLVMSLGYDPIWFGVIIIKLIEVGLITPPVGMNVYVVSAVTKIPLEEVFKGTGMMLVMECVSLVLLIAFPVLSIWLPGQMK